MGDVAHHVEARDALLLEEVGGVRVGLAKDRDQYVAGEDLVLAGRLHVRGGALDDALEPERLLRGRPGPFRQAPRASRRRNARVPASDPATSPPQWRMMSATSVSWSNAYRTCSMHRNSWRRRRASFTARLSVISSSRLMRMSSMPPPCCNAAGTRWRARAPRPAKPGSPPPRECTRPPPRCHCGGRAA